MEVGESISSQGEAGFHIASQERDSEEMVGLLLMVADWASTTSSSLRKIPLASTMGYGGTKSRISVSLSMLHGDDRPLKKSISDTHRLAAILVKKSA